MTATAIDRAADDVRKADAAAAPASDTATTGAETAETSATAATAAASTEATTPAETPAARGRGRFSACSPEWSNEFDAQLAAYVEKTGAKILADYRGHNPHDPIPAAVAA